MLSVSVQHVALARHHDTHDVLASRNCHGRVVRDREQPRWRCEDDENTKRAVSGPGSSTPLSLQSIVSTFLESLPASTFSSWPSHYIYSSQPETNQIGLRYIALEIMTAPPNSPMSLTGFLEADDEPTSPLPRIPTPSSRVKKLARAERLQISPSTLAQVKNRTPGTPSPLNSNRPVSKQRALDGALSIISPTARRAKNYDPETPKQFALTQFLHEERKSDAKGDAPIRGFSLKEFLQEDKQQENDELIDNIMAEVSSSSINSPSSPSLLRHDSSVKSKRPRVRKIRSRIISFGQSKDAESRPRRKFDPRAISKLTPTNEPSPFDRATSDGPFSVAKLFEEEQAQTAGDLVSVSDFLEQEASSIPRPDSPTLGYEFSPARRAQHDRAKLGQQEDDDVFKVRNSSFSNQRAQRGGPLAYKSPAPLRLPQKFDVNGLLTQLPAKDDFMASTVAALRSVSNTSPTRSNALLSPSKTPRRCATTPLNMQRATSSASRSTSRFSDASSSRPLLDRSNRDSIASTVGTKRHSLNTTMLSNRNSLASITEVKRRSDSSIADTGNRRSNPRVEQLQNESAESAFEATQDLAIPTIVEKRLSDASVSTTTSSSPLDHYSINRRLTIKKVRKWSPFSSSFSPRSPLTPSHSKACFPIAKAVTPKSPFALVKMAGCGDEAHEVHKQRVAKQVPITTPAILQLKFDHMHFDRGDVRAVEDRSGSLSLPEQEEQCGRGNAFAPLLGWSDHLGVDWGKTTEERKVICEQIYRAPEPQTTGLPRSSRAPTFTSKFQTVMESMSSSGDKLDSTITSRNSITETEKSPSEFSRRTSKAAFGSQTPKTPSFQFRTRSTTNQSSRSQTPMTPGMSRSTSSSEFPQLSPVTSSQRAISPAKYSFSSQRESKRPRAETISVVNPFGSFLYWDRPTETREEKKKRKLSDVEQKEKNQALEKEGVVLSSDVLQLNGKFRGMERYLAHDLVQRDLRNAYEQCDKAMVSAAEVARAHLDLLLPRCTGKNALDTPDVQPEPDMNLVVGAEGTSVSERRVWEWADLAMVGEEGIRNYTLVWAQRFLDRCEQNGW